MQITDAMVDAALKAHAETPGHITHQDDLYSIRRKKMRAAIEAALREEEDETSRVMRAT